MRHPQFYFEKEIKKNILKTQKEKENLINFSEFSSIWKDRNITQKDLRNKAWNKFVL
jgi:hypothetical protein